MVVGLPSHGGEQEGRQRPPVAPHAWDYVQDGVVHGAPYPRSDENHSRGAHRREREEAGSRRGALGGEATQEKRAQNTRRLSAPEKKRLDGPARARRSTLPWLP